ncbi:MAG: polysaccharide deacetylase family protein [Bifidobacteriaceae bacterium]|nr:polysaccharide deacetylase family protein [Bifidobacteriaceae bacterium]
MKKVTIFGALTLAVVLICFGVYMYAQNGASDSANFKEPTPQSVKTDVTITLHTDDETTKVQEKIGDFYRNLTIPTKDGKVFAGWYTASNAGERVNWLNIVPENDTELYARWVTVKENAESARGVPVLMYHWFYDDPKNALDGNWYDINEFKKQLQYLSDNDFYFPSWDELDAYIDGKLNLPPASVIITDDDAMESFINLAVPLIEKSKIPVTSFMISIYGHDYKNTKYIVSESHTHDMHRPGADGRGRMVNESVDVIRDDLLTSRKTIQNWTKKRQGLDTGKVEVLAYPFGHYNDTAKQALSAEKFKLAFTTEYGRVTIGADKLQLPRIRMSDGEGFESFKAKVD